MTLKMNLKMILFQKMAYQYFEIIGLEGKNMLKVYFHDSIKNISILLKKSIMFIYKKMESFVSIVLYKLF